MTSKITGITQKKGFYGWIALTGSLFSLFVIGGIFLQSFGVFLPVLTDEFGWSRASTAGAFSLGNLALGLPGPIWGILITRFGPRINIILGSIVAAVSLASIYFVHDLWLLYVLFLIAGLGAGIGGYITTTAVANNWFTKKVALAMGIVACIGGLSCFVFPPLDTALIEAVGWRLAWVILGGIILLGATVIGGIALVRNRPEDMGQVPDGIRPAPGKVDAGLKNLPLNEANQVEWPLRKLLKMRVTWFIVIFGIAAAVLNSTMTTHQVAYMQDIGFSPMTAATTMSIWAIGSVVASLAFGALALRINIRYLGAATFALEMIGLIILLTSRELVLMYIYSALIGASIGAQVAALPTFISTYFGRRLYSKVMGFAFALEIVVFAAAGAIAGKIYDATGGYTLAFIIVAVFAVIGLVCIFLARKPNLDVVSSEWQTRTSPLEVAENTK